MMAKRFHAAGRLLYTLGKAFAARRAVLGRDFHKHKKLPSDSRVRLLLSCSRCFCKYCTAASLLVVGFILQFEKDREPS
jgi:RNase P subunit RPR2